MSGLEKFQANEAWRAQIKKLLFMQRKITPLPQTPVEQSHRFSLDLADDLQVLLEEKAIPRNLSSTQQKKEGTHQREHKMFEDENDENESGNNSPFTTPSTIKKAPSNNFSTIAFCDDTFLDEQQMVQTQRISDESFEAMEKMCDKTASDPNSTLFQYIHGENKEEIVADAKKRSADGNTLKTPCKKDLEEIDEEAKALQRLLFELCVQEQEQLEDVSPLKGVDVTQLDDVEAPSKLWDSTIVGDTMLQTSPVKMVGLLRPSTILEECSEETSSVCDGSQLSFQSALKSAEASTSYYETARDSTGTSAPAPNYVAHKDKYVDECSISGSESVSIGQVCVSNGAMDLDESKNLINLDETLGTEKQTLSIAGSERDLKKAQTFDAQKESSSDESESVIEILSDDEVDETKVDINEEKGAYIKEAETAVHANPEKVLEQNLSFIDDDGDDDKENSVMLSENGDHSLHFNDTMEEVEYMMKKGLQYMAESVPCNLQPLVIESPTVVKQLITKENTFTFSPKKNERFHSAAASPRSPKRKPIAAVAGVKAKPIFASPKRTPQLSASKAKPVTKRFAMDIKPMPKLDIFKKPVASGIPNRLKEPSHKQFPHIISPVGTYMKKTATTPLMSNFKRRSSRPDMHNASVFRELEQESRIYKPKFDAISNNINTKTPSLPKKAYISSEFKHITDERTPVTIPGGKKIQKYIEGAMLPSVVRHEGKVKLPATKPGASWEQSKQRNNASLANLSVMSGDVSVYTVTDAQKF